MNTIEIADVAAVEKIIKSIFLSSKYKKIKKNINSKNIKKYKKIP